MQPPYSLATIGIFAILIKMKDYTFEGFNGLARHQPLLAATCTIFLLSLSGIPLTAGFFAKYYMLSAVLNTHHYLWLVIFAVLCAAVSVYYYFRVIQAMYFKDGDPQEMIDPSPVFKGAAGGRGCAGSCCWGSSPKVLLNQLSDEHDLYLVGRRRDGGLG